MTYTYKTKPRIHQHKSFCTTANKRGWGLFWKPGVGKTKPTIDTLGHLYLNGSINCAVVVAPNDVKNNWASDEIPKHMPDVVLKDTLILTWNPTKVATKKYQKAMKEFLHHRGLCILLVGYESTITPKFKLFMKRLFKWRRIDGEPAVAMILDESHRIKSAKSGCKKTIVAMGACASHRRILTGTPLEEPLDIYSQVRFLDQGFWRHHGFPTFEDYKQHFCVYRTVYARSRCYEQIVKYKNLDELAELIKKTAQVLTKEDAGLNLPPKTYTRRYVEMTPVQQRAYDQLKELHRTTLESGDELKAKLAVTRMLRLQQVACGYVATQKGQPEQQVDPKKNIKMDMCCAALKERNDPSIVFHRFKPDVNEMLRRLGKEALRFDGSVSQEDRTRARQAFQSGDVKYLIGSKAMYIGITLTAARYVDIYANSFSTIDREQLEDRAHRIGQSQTVLYTDWLAQGTVEEYIIRRLIEKKNVIDEVLQQEAREWLS